MIEIKNTRLIDLPDGVYLGMMTYQDAYTSRGPRIIFKHDNKYHVYTTLGKIEVSGDINENTIIVNTTVDKMLLNDDWY